MRNNCFVFPDFFPRNIGNSIKFEKNITPPPQTTPTFEIQNQHIMDIDSNCPYLLFGETTSHLSSKWRGTFQYFLPPPPEFFFLHQICFFLMLEIAWNAKKTWNIEDKKYLKFYFFQYLKNAYKIQTTFHQYQKLYSTPPWHGARTCKISRKYINAFLSYSVKTKRDGQTGGRMDRRTDGQTGGVAISPVPGLWRRGR